MKKVSFKWLFNATVLIASLGILCYFAFSKDGLLDLVKNVEGVSFIWLLAAFFCVVLNWALDCQILYIFTKNLHPEYRYRDCIRAAMTGQFFSAITPFASGGQPMQIYCMAQQGVNPSVSLSAMIQKFVVYQGGLTGYALVLLLLRGRFFTEHLGASMMVAIIAFAVNLFIIFFITVFSRSRKLTGSILRGVFSLLGKLRLLKNPEEKLRTTQEQLTLFHDNNLQLMRNKKLVLQSVGYTLLQLSVIFLVPFCIYKSFGYADFPVVGMLTANSIVNMIATFIPLPGGSGGAEGSFMIFFTVFFVLPGTLKPALFIWRFISYYLTVGIAAPFALSGKKREADQTTGIAA